MKLKIFIISLLTFLVFIPNLKAKSDQKPKLVVGIVIDQMRYDYLYKFYPYYSSGGFKRLMNEGSNFTFAHFNYVPTYTAPGHSSIYTGTTPYYHGIISNNWYDKVAKKTIYVTDDSTENTVGSNDDNGKMSPRRLMVTTITDQLKMATNGASKVIGISLKDRASILPAGHMADAAYWYDSKNGKFISSTFYIKKLPAWVDEFNSQKLADKYMSRDWELSLPLKDYEIAMPDQSDFEKDVFDEGNTTFPHSFKNIKEKDKYALMETTPYGNQILLEFAKAVLKNEKMGEGKYTDFLAVSFSSTDFIGHAYGPNSVEVEDTYIKLDKQIADLLSALDKQVGKGNYIVFLTADHGVVENNGYREEHKLNAGGLGTEKFDDSLYAFSQRNFGSKDIIANTSANQIFFNYEFIDKNKLNLNTIENTYTDYIRNTFPDITEIFTRDDLEKLTPTRLTTNLILNGFNPVRSGDIAYGLQAGMFPNRISKGTSHGTYYSYDTHVPILFYGWHIPVQTVNKPVVIIDIAPTIADLLKITEPDACYGIPLISE